MKKSFIFIIIAYLGAHFFVLQGHCIIYTMEQWIVYVNFNTLLKGVLMRKINVNNHWHAPFLSGQLKNHTERLVPSEYITNSNWFR